MTDWATRMPSTVAGGEVSRIVSSLEPGAGVVTTRGHVHCVVTEYGSVNLFGLSLRWRAEALIALAHPDAREISGAPSPGRVMSPCRARTRRRITEAT